MQQLPVFFLASLASLQAVLALQNSLSSHPPLRCCFMDEPPICFQNNRTYWNNGLDGVIKDYILEHQSYLNWTCSTIRPFEQDDSTQFNSFVTSLFECTNTSTGQIIDSPHCSCDVGLGGWFHTSSRFGKVDFLPPLAYDRYVVFAHVSEANVRGNVWFFIQTFDEKVWISIFALFVMFSFLKILDRRFADDGDYEPLPNTYSRFRRFSHYLTKSKLLFRVRKAVQSTVMRFLFLSDDHIVGDGSTMRQWFLNIILAVVALFLVSAYEAIMTASLVQESIETRFQSASDLMNCNVNPSEICILRGGALEIYWQNSIAIEECHNGNPPRYYMSYKSLFQAMDDRECKYAIMIESAVTAAIRGRYRGQFVIVGQPIFTNGLSMLLPKGSNLTEKMSQATLDLMGNRTTTYLTEYFNNLPQCRTEVNAMLAFSQLQMFFTITFSCGGALFLAMVFFPQPSSEARRSREVAGDKQRLSNTSSSCSSEVGRAENNV